MLTAKKVLFNGTEVQISEINSICDFTLSILLFLRHFFLQYIIFYLSLPILSSVFNIFVYNKKYFDNQLYICRCFREKTKHFC